MKTSLYSLMTKKRMSLREMGEVLGMTHKRVSYLVGKLENRGYVKVFRQQKELYNGKVTNEINVYAGCL